MLYCYLDESGKKSDHPVVTVSALCISESRLELFETAWNNLLREYGLEALHMARACRLSEKVCSKMTRNQSLDDRIGALIPFAQCIRAHFDYGFIQAMGSDSFAALPKDVRAKMGSLLDPYQVAFMLGLVDISEWFKNDYISIICDDDAETAWDCYKHYRAVRQRYPRVRERTASLTFADDKRFPALQAADMFAVLSRLETKSTVHGSRHSFHRLFTTLIDPEVGRTKWVVRIYEKEHLEDLGKHLQGKLRHAK